MSITRRDYLGLSLGAVAASATPSKAASLSRLSQDTSPTPFAVGEGTTYLNAASQHPMLNASREAVNTYLDHKQDVDATSSYRLDSEGPIRKFAQLVNADPDEVTYVQSTTTGEQMIVRSLGLPEQGAKIVTDTLHFFGSLPLYADLEKQGCEITWVRAKNNRILLEDMDKAITPGTKLVSVSLVSTINGFQHDLKALCEIAHSRGALVYADIIHAAGCVPIDLHESGVDFAACAGYKWLMGGFGLGFLYARKDALQHLQRNNWGYYGIQTFSSHVYPLDPPGETIVDYSFNDKKASGWFALGTHNHVTVAHQGPALDYILETGVEAIQAHAKPLTTRLKEGLRQQGFDVISDDEWNTPMVTAVYKDAYSKIGKRLRDAGIITTVSRNRFRPSVSMFNTMDDIEHFLDVLGPA